MVIKCVIDELKLKKYKNIEKVEEKLNRFSVAINFSKIAI